jgi:hypothetical protein
MKSKKQVYYLKDEPEKPEVREDYEIIKMHYDINGKRVHSQAFREIIFWYYFVN